MKWQAIIALFIFLFIAATAIADAKTGKVAAMLVLASGFAGWLVFGLGR